MDLVLSFDLFYGVLVELNVVVFVFVDFVYVVR